MYGIRHELDSITVLGVALWGGLRILTHAGPNSAIDYCTRRQPYSPKARWISYPPLL
ncbi:hypothetical protein PROAA_2730003 [Candidatus Propionivibrio aalborgensis]|uniref:Uncharacterized protein n=1 Tax=Candidatus Propionivibrio aalborgensis TaxID=1860101 RepID=A0A1A8XUL8_9RHOO|nr:hypothetical protein PROAA_2730003 [Candidatus Propionivibrio aalborgensis]